MTDTELIDWLLSNPELEFCPSLSKCGLLQHCALCFHFRFEAAESTDLASFPKEAAENDQQSLMDRHDLPQRSSLV